MKNKYYIFVKNSSYTFSSLDEAKDYARKIAHENKKILICVYHYTVNEPSKEEYKGMYIYERSSLKATVGKWRHIKDLERSIKK